MIEENSTKGMAESIPPRHPAKYTDALLPVFARWCMDSKSILDPFAGTGKIGMLKDYGVHAVISANDIEKDWLTPNIYHCDKLYFQDAEFLDTGESYDTIVTSPTYGNRMADHFHTEHPERRATYTHCIGHELDDENTGRMHFGKAYCEKHRRIFAHLYDLLIDGGIFILNCSNFIRAGEIVDVTSWMRDTMESVGFKFCSSVNVSTPRMRFGANSDKRVEYETVMLFHKGKD